MSSAPPSTHLMKRLMREVQVLRKEDQAEVGVKIYVPGVSGEGSLTDPWIAYVRGPPDTPYDGCVYMVRVEFGSTYPHAPPSVMFLNRCWHPNIGVNGHVCVDILSSQWAPALTVLKLLQGVQSLLDDPDPTSPLNGQAGDDVRRARNSGDWNHYRSMIVATVGERRSLSEAERAFTAGVPVLMMPPGSGGEGGPGTGRGTGSAR